MAETNTILFINYPPIKPKKRSCLSISMEKLEEEAVLGAEQANASHGLQGTVQRTQPDLEDTREARWARALRTH